MRHELNPCDFCGQSVTIKEYMREQLYHLEKHRWYMGQDLNRPVSDDELITDWIESGNAFQFHNQYRIKQ